MFLRPAEVQVGKSGDRFLKPQIIFSGRRIWRDKGIGSIVFLLPRLEVGIVGEYAHLFQILDDGQLGPHLHLGGQDFPDEVGGFVELPAEEGDLEVAEEILEIIDGGLGVAEELHLLAFLAGELVDGIALLEVTHGLSVHVLAEVLGLKPLPLLGRSPLAKSVHRNLQDAAVDARLLEDGGDEFGLGVDLREELLLLLFGLELVVLLLGGGELDLGGEGLEGVAEGVEFLVVAGAGGLAGEEVRLGGFGDGAPEGEHLGDLCSVVWHDDVVALTVALLEPVVVVRGVVVFELLLVVHVKGRLSHIQFIFYYSPRNNKNQLFPACEPAHTTRKTPSTTVAPSGIKVSLSLLENIFVWIGLVGILLISLLFQNQHECFLWWWRAGNNFRGKNIDRKGILIQIILLQRKAVRISPRIQSNLHSHNYYLQVDDPFRVSAARRSVDGH